MAVNLSQRGAPGANGVEFIGSNRNPLPEEGTSNAYWLNHSTQQLFKKLDGMWTPLFVLKGRTGGKGEPGASGLNVYYRDVDPVDTFGRNGEGWVNFVTHEQFLKDGGTWVSVGTIAGPPGSDGSNVHMAPVDPEAGDGADGDGWVNGVTGDTFVKAAGAWTSLGNIKGADGTKFTTSNVDPTGGSDGDGWLNTATWIVWRRSGGTWSPQGSILGASGDGTGDMIGPGTSTPGNLVVFLGTDGKQTADSGLSASDLTGDLDDRVSDLEATIGTPATGLVDRVAALEENPAGLTKGQVNGMIHAVRAAL